MRDERKLKALAARGEQLVSISEKRSYFLEVMSKLGPKVLDNIGTIKGTNTGITGVALGVHFGISSRAVFSGDACAMEFNVQIQDAEQKPISIDRLYLLQNDYLCEDVAGSQMLAHWMEQQGLLEWLLVRVADKIVESSHFAPAR